MPVEFRESKLRKLVAVFADAVGSSICALLGCGSEAAAVGVSAVMSLSSVEGRGDWIVSVFRDDDKSAIATSAWPFTRARCNGVFFLRSLESVRTPVPRLRRISTIFKDPLALAACNAI